MRWLAISGETIFSAGPRYALRMHGVAVDITERKTFEVQRERLLEAERVARNEAESAVRAKDEFLAMLSHELRTPLANVVSWAHVLQKNSPGSTISWRRVCGSLSTTHLVRRSSSPSCST